MLCYAMIVFVHCTSFVFLFTQVRKWHRVKKINEILTVLNCQWWAMHIYLKSTHHTKTKYIHTYMKYYDSMTIKKKRKKEKITPKMNHTGLMYANNSVCLTSYFGVLNVAESTNKPNWNIQWRNAMQSNVITFTCEAEAAVFGFVHVKYGESQAKKERNFWNAHAQNVLPYANIRASFFVHTTYIVSCIV